MPVSPEFEAELLERIHRIPVISMLKPRFEHFGDGTCTAVFPPDPRYNGSFDSFHGGLLATAADTLACFAVMTLIGTDDILTTTDLHIRYLAACLTDVRVETKVIKIGRTLCPVDVKLTDMNGKLVAVASVSYMRLPKMPDR